MECMDKECMERLKNFNKSNKKDEITEFLKKYWYNNNIKYMKLKIFIDSDDNELIDKYINSINEHHLKLFEDLCNTDAGFDLLTPENQTLITNKVNKVDYKIVCSAQMIEEENKTFNTGFYMYPRSSISKTQLRLANNVGIIDSGYRGHLIGMFDCIYSDKNEISINKYDRHLQICSPGLIPIIIELVSSIEELGKTIRGTGGFGSTGI